MSYFVKFLHTDVTNRESYFFEVVVLKRCSKTRLSADFIMILGEIKFVLIFAYRHNKSLMKQQFSIKKMHSTRANVTKISRSGLEESC